MMSFSLALYIAIIFTSATVPFYLSGRVFFLSAPIAVNLFAEKKERLYNSWNSQRIIIVFILFTISFTLSIFWGQRILTQIRFDNIDYDLLVSYLVLQGLSYILFELKMEHPFNPILALKTFIHTNYYERFHFYKKLNKFEIVEKKYLQFKEETIRGIESISDKLQRQEAFLMETNEFVKLNNKILQESDFAFEIKKKQTLAIGDIMHDYLISEDSEKVLSDFLLRKKKSGTILFIKPARNGVSVQPILDFFSTFTNVISNCRLNITTQAETVKIINSISSAKDRLGNVVDEPVNVKNLSKYLSGGDDREEIYTEN